VEEQGTVEVSIEEPTPSLLDEMLEVERASWKWERGLAFLKDPDIGAFLREAIGSGKVPVQMWTCRIDGAMASFAVVFPHSRKWLYYWPSYREDRWGSGMLLMSAIVEQCFLTEAEEFDFLGGDEDYKLRWMTHERHTQEIIIAGRWPFGPICALGFRTRWRLAQSERLKEWRKRILVALRNRRSAS
jgi:CelD/BcsL family acetyltransferase involved in cellulose biosynthesis